MTADYIFLLLALVFCVIYRLFWSFKFGSHSTVDGHLWIRFATNYREVRRLPIRTPEYLMGGVEQLYPPLFYIIVSKFLWVRPTRLRIIFNQLPDLIIITVFLIIGLIENVNTLLLIMITLIYCSTPILVSYNSQLNPRALGNLVFLAILGVYFYVVHKSPELWIFVVFLCIATALSLIAFALHKMTFQSILGLSLVTIFIPLDGLNFIIPIGVALSIYAFRLLVGRLYFAQTITARLGLLGYHRRNRDLNGAHQVFYSKLYEKYCDGTEINLAVHKPGFFENLKKLLRFLAYNPSVLLFVLLINLASPILITVTLSLSFLALLTLWIPGLRMLGSGYLYQFNIAGAVLFLPFLIEEPFTSTNLPNFLFTTLLLIILVNFVVTMLTHLHRKSGLGGYSSNSRNEELLISKLFDFEPSRVLALPTQICERIATETRHAVLWIGGDSIVQWQDFELFFPVLKRDIRYFVDRYNIGFIVINKQYWPMAPAALAAEMNLELFEMPGFYLFKIQPASVLNENGRPV